MTDQKSLPVPARSYLRSDTPITRAAEQDRLGRAQLARQLAERILRFDGERALAVGIAGHWGSGKTSFVNLVIEALKSNAALRPNGALLEPVIFTPWTLGTRHDMARDLVTELGRVLKSKPGQGGLAAEIGTDLVTLGAALVPALCVAPSLDPQTVVTGVGGVLGVTAAIKALVKPYVDRVLAENATPSLQEQLQKISEKLRKSRALLVIALDDLERLPADQIQDVFRVVGTIANFANTVYLLSMDRHRVAEAISVQYGDGHAYLEKFLHLTFDLPLADPPLLSKMFFDELNGIYTAREIEVSERRFSELWHGGLKGLVDTPRDIIRILNVYDMALESVGEETDAIDLLGLEALRVTEPSAHRALHEHPISVLRVYRDLLERITNQEKSREHGEAAFSGVIGASSERHRDTVTWLLRTIFPAVLRVGATVDEAAHRARRAASPDHFDNYFRWGLSSESISERALRDAIEALLRAITDLDIEHWVREHREHFGRLGRKLRYYLPDFAELERPYALASRLLRAAHLLANSAPALERSDYWLAMSLALELVRGRPSEWANELWRHARPTTFLFSITHFYVLLSSEERHRFELVPPANELRKQICSAVREAFIAGRYDTFPRFGEFLLLWGDLAGDRAGPRALVATWVADRNPAAMYALRSLIRPIVSGKHEFFQGTIDQGNMENLTRLFDPDQLAGFLDELSASREHDTLIAAVRRTLKLLSEGAPS